MFTLYDNRSLSTYQKRRGRYVDWYKHFFEVGIGRFGFGMLFYPQFMITIGRPNSLMCFIKISLISTLCLALKLT